MRPSLKTPTPARESLPAWSGRRVGAGARDRAGTRFELPEEPARPATAAQEPAPARRHDARAAAGDRREAASRPNEDRRSERAEPRERPEAAGKGESRRAAEAHKARESRNGHETSSADDAAAAEEPDTDGAAGSDAGPDGTTASAADGLPVDPDGKGSSDEENGDGDASDEEPEAAEADGSADAAAAAALAALVPPSDRAAAQADGTAEKTLSVGPSGSAAASLSKDLPVPAALADTATVPGAGDPKAAPGEAAAKDGAILDPHGSKPEAGRREAAPEHEKAAHRHLEASAQAAEFKADAAPTSPAPASHSAAQAGGVGPAGQAAQANPAAQAQTVPVLNQVPLGAVPIEIGLKSLSGMNRFEIRLDPAELGRIDVRLDIGDGGDVKAHLVVDRVETLALLQRDAKTLERAFEQAGLKPSEGSIDLSLRDPGSDRRGSEQGGSEQGRRATPKNDDVPAVERAEAVQKPRRMLWRGATGVDLRI